MLGSWLVPWGAKNSQGFWCGHPNIDRTGEGAIVYTARSNQQSAIEIFYPDASKMLACGAYR
jgi:hypothetical protein